MENSHVVMIREDLEDIPQFGLPAPYSVRWYRPGDEATWLRIQKASDKYNVFTPQKFDQEFGRGAEVLKQRQCYLCDADGNEIGTMTAWLNDHFRGRRYGRVHWVAIVPEMQGKGLAKPLMAVTCNRLRSLGHDRAYLTSATVRIPALNLYLKFGFVPEIRSDEDVRAWRLVGPHLRPEYWNRAASRVPELA